MKPFPNKLLQVFVPYKGYFQPENESAFYDRNNIVNIVTSFLLSLGEPYENYFMDIDKLQYWNELTLEKTTEFVLSFLTEGVGGGAGTFLGDLDISREFLDNLLCWLGKPQCILGNWKRNSPHSGGSGFMLFKPGKYYVHDEGFILIAKNKIGLLFFFGED
jgi:hypothetical protein